MHRVITKLKDDSGAGDQIYKSAVNTHVQSDRDATLDDETNADEMADSLVVMTECETDKLDQLLEYIGRIVQKHFACCICTLQLVVADGLKTAKFMDGIQSKASRLHTLLHTSGIFEQDTSQYKKTTAPAPKTNSTRWNTTYYQLAACAKLDSSKLQKVLAKTKNDVCIFKKRWWSFHNRYIILPSSWRKTLLPPSRH